jgi:hypothetical protein
VRGITVWGLTHCSSAFIGDMERGRQVRAEVSVPDSSALHKMTVEFAMKRSIVPYLGMHLRWPSCRGVPYHRL